LKDLEHKKTKHTQLEKNDIQRVRDKFRMFDSGEGETTKIMIDSDIITVVGMKIEGRLWCELSTSLRCSGEEALSFLLDITSRSLMSERDVISGEGEGRHKKVVREEGYSRTVKIVEKMTAVGGIRYNNKIIRKLVFEKRNSARSNSHDVEIVVAGTTSSENAPATDNTDSDELRSAASTVDRKTEIHHRMTFGLRRSSEASETKSDTSIVAVKIHQVGEEESTIEVLLGMPKQYKKRKETLRCLSFYRRKTRIESIGVSTVVSETEKKEMERLLPTLYDYRTLSTMQRVFQRSRQLNSLDERDGEVIGKMLMENTSGLFDVKERSEKVSERSERERKGGANDGNEERTTETRSERRKQGAKRRGIAILVE